MLVLLLSTLALAEEPTFEGTTEPAEEVEKAETKLSAEFGGSLTSGNTDFYNLSSTVNGSVKWKANQFALVGSLLNGKGVPDTDGDGTLSQAERDAGRVRTAQRASLDARYDRFFGEKNSLYVLGGVFNDPFAGYDLRSHEQVGYSRLLVSTDATTIKTEIGADLAQENYIDGIDPNNATVFAARLLVGAKHTFNDAVSLEDTVEMYENLIDTTDLRLLNNLALTAKLSDKFSVKLNHALIFDNQPVEGFRPVDQTVTATLVATLL